MIGILSDAHGNIAAFQAAIAHLRTLGAKSFYYLGDAVGYIPSLDVVDELMSMRKEVKCIRGNHEELLFQDDISPRREAIYQFKPLKERLSTNQINFIKSWPTHLQEVIDDINVLFVHGSPRDYTNEYVYPDTDLKQFNTCSSFVFMGHTHLPFLKNSNGTTFVNVGSCGLPRDDGRYGSFATFDPSTRNVKLYRYAIDKFMSKLSSYNLEEINPSVLKVFKRRSNNISESSFKNI